MTQAHPLQWPPGWPRTPVHQQQRGDRFIVHDWSDGHRVRPISFAAARDSLIEELVRLGADRIVISSNHPLDRYGDPREGKRIADEGIAVYFALKGKGMAMACDRYTTAACNMRSLALAIDGMRKLDRHGGGAMVERAFAGFVALPPPESPWHVLGISKTTNISVINLAYRNKAKLAHPDAGGSTTALARLNSARERALFEINQGAD